MTQLMGTILILLSQQGQWYGGQPASITVKWPAVDVMPPAELQWQLCCAGAELSKGALRLQETTGPTTLEITPPEVRAKTRMEWSFCIVDIQDRRELVRGKRVVTVYPQDAWNQLANRLKGVRIAVIDPRAELATALSAAHVVNEQNQLIEGVDALRLTRADIVLVAENAPTKPSIAGEVLLNQARAGATVCIFAQTDAPRVLEYSAVPRRRPERLQWRADHPLLDGLEAAIGESWTQDLPEQVWALQLPPDEPALEIVWWPPEIQGAVAAPIDALIAVKQVERGRVIYIQIPLGTWGKDPRADLLLRNVLDYARRRPEPTPPPADRDTKQKQPPVGKPRSVRLPGATP